ncbi:hypothetical protein [Yinghuangia soli]|uniref:Uncharacterized protein n=1 Tax=Yinghuangia soli TaxID=2908204 RepID=A0AA41Q965_9ACTN|nr:hypothetical protein [Yinghuangia soli]MCF2532644.1 hypothetical protein [Yinghuangia soli]
MKTWSVVAAVLAAGLRYDGNVVGCYAEQRRPRARPRTRRELAAYEVEALEAGVPFNEHLDRVY